MSRKLKAFTPLFIMTTRQRHENCRLLNHYLSLPHVRDMKTVLMDLKTGGIAYAPKCNVVRKEHRHFVKAEMSDRH